MSGLGSTNFQALLSGENGTAVPAVNELEALDKLLKMSDPARQTGPFGPVVKETLRVFESSATLLNNNAHLRLMLGGLNIGSIAKLAPLMQEMLAKDTIEAMIRPGLPAQRPEMAAAINGVLASSSQP